MIDLLFKIKNYDLLGSNLDYTSNIILFLDFLLVFVIILTVWNIVRYGIIFSISKEDAEKYQMGLKNILNTLVVLFIVTLLLIIINYTTNVLK
ncbi:hypothetical protein [Herpetosiphon llansteffanensis]|uniref:hypothetical protein n=1 Tax=Herpetosiphon llansteffanensis TaxID=2094568 RepID=UPI000D7CAFF5|nr:hypothetical protein [Herpetosiphon llansteffanensis]